MYIGGMIMACGVHTLGWASASVACCPEHDHTRCPSLGIATLLHKLHKPPTPPSTPRHATPRRHAAAPPNTAEEATPRSARRAPAA